MDRMKQCKLEAGVYLSEACRLAQIAAANVDAFPEHARTRIQNAIGALHLAEARLKEADDLTPIVNVDAP